MKGWLAIAPLLWPALLVALGDLYALTHYQLSCLIAPQGTFRGLGIVALVAANLVLVLSMAWQLGRMALVSRRIRRLEPLAAAHRARLALPELERVDIRVIAEDVPMCFTVGGLRPTIVISRWMLEQLDPAERRAAVAHELAHVQQGDGLVMLLLRGLCPGGFGLGSLRRRFEAVARELELRADAIAASRLADPLALASALVKVGRATRAWQPSLGFAEDSSLLEARITALMQGGKAAGGGRFWENTRFLALGLASLAAWLSFVGHLCVRGLV